MEKITGIKIDFPIYLGIDRKPLEKLSPISKINIFVGANNSGKSRFLRNLFSANNYMVSVEKFNLTHENEIINSFIINIVNKLNEHNLSAINGKEVSSFSLFDRLPIYFNTKADVYDQFRNELKSLSLFPEITSVRSNKDIGFNQQKPLQKIIIENSQFALNILNQIPTDIGYQRLNCFYLPVLRGLRPISNDIDDDFYKVKTTEDYFQENTNVANFIFTGLDFYKEIRKLSLGIQNERQLKAEYQEFLSTTLFEGNIVELTSNEAESTVYVQIGEEEYPIHNLGDGIQSIIILTFLPFITQEPTFFFIEEPELFLHPGMQRKIMEFFHSDKGNLQQHTFFLTTHSNHFLDLTIDYSDVSIFTFQKKLTDGGEKEKESKFIVQAVDICDRSSLECLGVRNSSVFLVNATIWVEGITDRWYLRAMLNKYMDMPDENGNKRKQFEEDVHYSFVEYGGSNITHWSFLDYEEHPIEVERLCARAMVIIDEDGNSKLKRKDKLKQILNDNLIILPTREIENLLAYPILITVIQDYENDSKRELPSFTNDDYKSEKIGAFIEDQVLTGTWNREGGYKDDSGTIKTKVSFCKKAYPMIKDYELSPDAISIVDKIYKFIESQNT